MATDAGSIEYSVDVGTSSVLQADKIVKKSTDKIAKQFQVAEKSVDSFNDEMMGLTKGTTSAGRGMDKLAGKVKKSDKAVKAMSRSTGMAGIQFQQFIGQVQGGQSPMLAFSQQSADLGFVLGFPLLGAITGIAASITGIFLPSLLNGEDAVGRLKAVMESLRETAITTEDGITLLSSGIEKLAKKSKAAAAIEIELAIKKANAAIMEARGSIREAADEWAGFGQGTSLLDQQFALAEKASKRLGKTIEELTTGKGVDQEGLIAGIFGIEEAKGIRDAVASTAKEFKISKKSALEYLESLNGFKNRRVTFEEFSETILNISKANKNANKSFDELASAAGKATASAAEAKDILKVLNLASEDLDKTLSEASEGGFKKQKEAADELTKSLDDTLRAEMRLEMQAIKKAETDRNRLTQAVSKTGLTPLQKLQLDQSSEILLLQQGFDQKIILEQDFLTRSAELNKQHKAQLKTLDDKSSAESIAMWSALENQAIGSLASIATGAQTGTEAMSALAKTILTQAIGALIKMGIQAVIGQKVAEVTGLTTAATLSAAYATPAALVSLASFGANAAPAAAGIASTVGLAQSLSLSGAREHGGPVSAGSSYLVGERGPEIFTPTGGGGITSNKESFGGGTTLNVMIENNTPNNVSTQLSDDGKQLKVFINEVANQISSNQGAIPRAMRQSTDTKFKAR